jgi:Flp pilus assembly protein TadB
VTDRPAVLFTLGAPALVLALALVAWPAASRTALSRSPVASAGPSSASGLLPPALRRAGRRGRRRPPVDDPRGVEAAAAALDLLALALRGGIGLVGAIESVAALSPETVSSELRAVSAAMRWGIQPADAWAAAKPVWRVASRALVLSAHAGIPPADLVARAAEDLREAERQRIDVATSRLGVRLVLPLGLAFLPGFVLTTVVPLVLALARQALSS